MMRLSVPSAAAAATRSALVQPTAAAAAASSARRGMATGKDISFGVSATRTATGGGEQTSGAAGMRMCTRLCNRLGPMRWRARQR